VANLPPVQNPFSRLKHYRPGENHSKENHATESLAACLVLSEDFREIFIAFLFGGADRVPEQLAKNDAEIEVETQHSTDEGKFLDILLTAEGYAVVVEVKVGASETEAQLDNYEHWLQEHYRKWSLFTLVQRDAPFQHRSAQRRFWADLYAEADRFATDSKNPTDGALLSCFCNYLTTEGIVMNTDFTKLMDYGKGWAAEQALSGLFNEIEQNVLQRFGSEPLNTDRFEPKGWPPALMFGRNGGWEGIFGKSVTNCKVTLWCCTSATVPSVSACEFHLWVQLWNPWHRNPWEIAAGALPAWFNHFDEQSFEKGSYPKRSPWPRCQWTPWNTSETLDSESWYCVKLRRPLTVTVEQLEDIECLSRELAGRVEGCIKLVDGLPNIPQLPA